MEPVTIPEEIYWILRSALWSLENNDNSMGGQPTADAHLAMEWLDKQEYTND